MQRRFDAQLRAAKRGDDSQELQVLRKEIAARDVELATLRRKTEEMSETMAARNVDVRVDHLPNTGTTRDIDRLKKLHARQLMEQADEHQMQIQRLRVELRASSKALAKAECERGESSPAPEKARAP